MFPFDYWMLPWSGQGLINPEFLHGAGEVIYTYTYCDCSLCESSYEHFVNWGNMGGAPVW